MTRPSRRMWTCLLLSGAVMFGCAMRGDLELLEARLRDREDEIAGLNGQLASTRNEAAVARRDAEQLRGQLVQRGDDVLLPEQADALYRATDLTITGLVTAGVDSDGQPGDDGIVTTIVPRDATGSPVKLPGRLVVLLSTRPETETADPVDLQRWIFPADELRKHWQQDLLAGGFRLQLPIEVSLQGAAHTLAATLETADGRTLETTHDLDLRTAEANRREAAKIVPASATARRRPPVALPPIDGGDDPNGNGIDRTRPTRTSDVFEADAGRRYQ